MAHDVRFTAWAGYTPQTTSSVSTTSITATTRPTVVTIGATATTQPTVVTFGATATTQPTTIKSAASSFGPGVSYFCMIMFAGVYFGLWAVVI